MTDSIIADLGIDMGPSSGFEPRVVTASIISASPDVAVLRTVPVDGSRPKEMIMPVTEWYPDRKWAVGSTFQVLQLDDSPRPLASVVRPELVEALLIGVSPEVRNGSVRVMAVARQAGVRSKIAVAATEPGIDAIASCVGKGACRVKYLSEVLAGERVDVIAWHPQPEVYLANALAPAKVTSVTIDGNLAVAHAPAHLMSAAVGAAGLNSQLAGQLVGVIVTVAPD